MPSLPAYIIDRIEKRRQPENRPHLEVPLPPPRPAPTRQTDSDRGVTVVDFTVNFEVI